MDRSGERSAGFPTNPGHARRGASQLVRQRRRTGSSCSYVLSIGSSMPNSSKEARLRILLPKLAIAMRAGSSTRAAWLATKYADAFEVVHEECNVNAGLHVASRAPPANTARPLG